jgi:hypothetical protein
MPGWRSALRKQQGRRLSSSSLSRSHLSAWLDSQPSRLAFACALLRAPGSCAWMRFGGVPTMQPREAVPLWVGLTLGLMIVGAVMYLTGYFVLEDFLAFFK